MEDIQKDISEIEPIHTSEKEYYGQAGRFSDGKEPSLFMKNNNNFKKMSEVDDELKAILKNKAIQANNGKTDTKDIYVVIPKENSQLYNEIKNSPQFQQELAKFYKNRKNQKSQSIEFPLSIKGENSKRALSMTLHRAELSNIKNNDTGDLSVNISDIYDFSKMPTNKNDNIKQKGLKFINNNAYRQQEKDKITKYLLSTDINISKEELEEIMKKYGNL